jgi:hypothetical protein
VRIDEADQLRPLSLTDHIAAIGDPGFVIDMIVGDTQRVIEFPQAGFAAEDVIPPRVHDAYKRLIEQGFTTRLITR